MPARYLGVFDIQLRTFTTTYVSFHQSGWDWQHNSLQPMEMCGRNDQTVNPSQAISFGCSVFDYATGVTKYSFGDLTQGTINDNFGHVLWKRSQGNAGSIAGFIFGSAITDTPASFTSPVVLGTPITSPGFQTSTYFVLPNTSNTGCPSPVAGDGWYTSSGAIQCSYRLSLVEYQIGVTLPGQATGINFGPFFRFTLSIPYQGLNYIFITDPSGNPPQIVTTFDYVTVALGVPIALQNPASASIDLNAYVTSPFTSYPTATYQGFLWMNKNSITINGQTLNGFGILAAPDFSSYKILNIVPVDAQAANWNTGVSDVQGKFDDTGIMWLKATSSPDTIYSQLPTASHTLETFPPLGLPEPPHDAELGLRANRGLSI